MLGPITLMVAAMLVSLLLCGARVYAADHQTTALSKASGDLPVAVRSVVA